MQVPLELSFRGLRGTPDLETKIRRRVDKLEKFHPGIISCRVAVERPHQHQSSGNPYRVRVDVTVPPGHEIVVRKEPGSHGLNENLQTVLVDAFEAAERQLKELKAKQTGEVKTHDEPRGFVVRLFEEEGYGFLKTPDDREIYFHRNALADKQSWERLTVGTQVRFAESMGEKGPQASTVQIVDKPGVRTNGEEEEAEEGAGGAEGTERDERLRAPMGWRRREG